MKLLATGAKGAVGSYIEEVFGAEHDLILVDRDELDVTERDDCAWITAQKPDVVLHLAAATDVDLCERQPDFAWRTNAVGTLNVAMASRETRFVYVSTAGVFGGQKDGAYNEYDKAIPANTYGIAKLWGERFAETHHPAPLIVRSGWMFGGGPLDKKFVGKIRNQLEAGYETIWAVDDKIGSPTYAKDLLGAIRRLLAAEQTGVFHGANEGVCTRHDVACEIVDCLDYKAVVERTKGPWAGLDAKRARSEALDSLRMREEGVEPSRPWREALREYLA